MSHNKSNHNKKQQANQLRIIGGLWRGRKLSFPSLNGLRPTPDRVRETLFNWLSTDVADAYCLDLFAGSGALGLEALSRGASHVDFVDNTREAIAFLQQNLKTLNTHKAGVHLASANTWLQSNHQSYDIIFLDAPFGQSLNDECITIIASGHIKAGGYVYLETGINDPMPKIPTNWLLHREKTAGQVCFRLFKIYAG